MSRTITISIPFTIQPKQADRSRIATTKSGKQWVQHYQPADVRHNADSLAALVAPYRPAVPLDCPIEVDVCYCFPWASSVRKWQHECGWWPRDTKPDLDNCTKQLMDVLQRCGFFTNDSRIWRRTESKISADQACILLTIKPTEIIKTRDGRQVPVTGPAKKSTRADAKQLSFSQ